MFSYITYKHNQPPSNTHWHSTAQVRKGETTRILGLVIQILIIVGALTLLILSQQGWSQDLWLAHPATYISSAIVVAMGCLDILATSLVVLSHLKIADASEESNWKNVTCAGTKTHKDNFITALEKQGVNPKKYKLVIFREASLSRPYLFGSYDATAADYHFNDGCDKDPHNLSNYNPEEVMVVTHYFPGHDEESLLNAPFNTSFNTKTNSNFWNNCTYIHMNGNDLAELNKNQALPTPIIQAIQEGRKWSKESVGSI